MKNGIFVPPHMHGTSFSDITESIDLLIKRNNFDISFIGSKSSLSGNKMKDNFLDVESDIVEYYEKFGTLLKDVDGFGKLLFIDFFAPGIDILKYMLEIKGKKMKLGALMHGGSFLPRDLYKRPRLKFSEELWFDVFDVIYVPSKHLYNLVPEKFKKKIKILPWGMDYFLSKEMSPSKEKTIDILFPHRLDDDKGIDDLVYIISRLPEYTFVITSFRNLEGNKYYIKLKRYKNIRFIFGESEQQHIRTLSKAKIVLSCAYQENFGYGIVKSVLSGALPVLPDREVYPELFPSDFLYHNLDEAVEKIKHILENKKNYSLLSKKMKKVCEKMSTFSFSKILKDFYGFSL